MTTITGTAGNDKWYLVGPGTVTLDGLGGTDTLYMGTSLRSSYTITKASDGAVHVDTISGASSAFHGTLYNMEILVFNNGADTLDLTTYFTPTTPPPTVMSYSPAAQATGVATNSDIVLSFSESIVRGTGSINIVGAGGSVVASYDAATSSNLTIVGNTLTIHPSSALATGTAFTVVFAAGSIKDLAGNSYAGSSTYGFTTGAGAVITGGSGNDILASTSGNDTIDGGVGTDTVTYKGNLASYVITKTSTGYTVADSVAGRDGTDTLINVERLHFSDKYIAFDTSGDAGQAYRLYQAALNRTPDAGGLGYQLTALDNGLPLASVAQNFINSPEFAATYGALNTTDFVQRMYQNVLHRTGVQSELDYYVPKIDSGAMTRAAVLVGFSESPENQAAVIGVIQNGMTYTV